jgi:hypothetical protein
MSFVSCTEMKICVFSELYFIKDLWSNVLLQLDQCFEITEISLTYEKYIYHGQNFALRVCHGLQLPEIRVIQSLKFHENNLIIENTYVVSNV